MVDPNPLARVRTRTIAGRTFRLHRLSIADFLELEDWVNRQFPDPLGVAQGAIEAGGFTVAQQQYLLREALALACKGRRKLGTPEADEKAMSVEGTLELLYLSLKKGDPAVERAELESLRDLLTPADVLIIMADTDADKVIDPKASSPPTTTGLDLTPGAFGPESGRSPTP